MRETSSLLVREKWEYYNQATASAQKEEDRVLWSKAAVEAHNLLNKLETLTFRSVLGENKQPT